MSLKRTAPGLAEESTLMLLPLKFCSVLVKPVAMVDERPGRETSSAIDLS